MENKLISMTDYLPNHPCSKFLKQPLDIWMFIPCKLVDGVWVVLEEIETGIDLKFHPMSPGNEASKYWAEYKERVKEYQEAKDRVLFEGFEKDNSFVTHKSHASFFYPISCLHEKSIEDLVKHNLELTPTALKKFNLLLKQIRL